MTALNARQMALLNKIVKAEDKIGGATQAEAARLLRDGLIVRVSGKGHGAGNTPLWSATQAGRELVGVEEGETTKISVGKRAEICTLVADTGTGYKVRRPSGDIVTVPYVLCTVV